MLNAAPPKVAACIALQAFAGVRSEEMLRLTWEDLERRLGYIEVTARQAKTASRRLIPILPNLAQWLAAARRIGEPVWPHSKPAYSHALAAAAKRAGVKWRTNALRHSFITYRLAATKDVAEVASKRAIRPP